MLVMLSQPKPQGRHSIDSYPSRPAPNTGDGSKVEIREAKQFRVLRTSCDAERYQFGWRTRAQQVEICSTIHLALEKFQSVDLPFNCPLLQGDSKAALRTQGFTGSRGTVRLAMDHLDARRSARRGEPSACVALG
jgi:hypothetical protein